MRREPYTVGNFVHAIKRGARGLPIVFDNGDRWRFLLALRHFNDQYQPQNWFRDLLKEDLLKTMKRPSLWPEQEPLVKILAYTLLDNHFHLMLKEIREGGISIFMQRLGIGMSKGFVERYREPGSIFQGPYKSVTVETDQQLRYLAVYIMVKNTFEMYPEGGLREAVQNFDRAWQWAIHYPYSALGDYAGVRKSPIIEKDILGEIFTAPEQFRTFAKECMEMYEERLTQNLTGLMLDEE